MRLKLEFVELGIVADFRNGLNFSKATRGKGCLLIGIPDFKNRSTPEYDKLGEIDPDGITQVDDFVKKHDILFVRSNGNKELVGRSLFIDKEVKALYSGFCIRTRINQINVITPKFFFYFTKSSVFKSMISSSGGTSIQNLNQEILSKVRIPLFSFETQTQIAKVLSDLDAKIELNNKINAELEAMAKLIYDYWFVQFEFPCLPQDYRPSGQVNPNFDLKEKIRSFCTYKQTGGLPLPDGRSWFVYVLLCDDGSFYKGMTNDLYRRYYEHGTGQGAHHTKVHKPVKVIHWEQFDTQEEAALREKELKTGFGRTWIQREYEKLQKQQEKPGSPAHQNARLSKLMPAGKMVWNEELKRDVPEDWECKRLSEFANTGSGGTPLKSKQEYFENGKIPWINSGEVNMPFITKAEKFITEKGLTNSSAKLFPKGTILMAMYGATAGKVSLMDLEASTNQAICGINPKKDYYSIFLKYGLEDLYQYLINLSSGSARDNLSQEKIRELKFAFPTDTILKSYHEKANPLLVKILNNMKQNEKLAELRDWLLPMLMNGQVRVGDVAKYEIRGEDLGMVAEGKQMYGGF